MRVKPKQRFPVQIVYHCDKCDTKMHINEPSTQTCPNCSQGYVFEGHWDRTYRDYTVDVQYVGTPTTIEGSN